jgi:DNA invertase Pin-like site-specific DNA recombinase
LRFGVYFLIKKLKFVLKMDDKQFMSSAKTKVIGYVRVSTKKQTETGVRASDKALDDFVGHSIAEQKDKIIKFCDYKGFDLVKIFQDPAISAKKTWFFNRETGIEIQKLLSEDPEIKYIVVKVQDRVFRDAEDALRTLRILKEKYDVNLYVESNGDMVNLQDPNQKLLFGIQALLDEYTVAKNNQRTSQVLRYKQSNGLILGRTPLGYKRTKDSPGLVVDFQALKMITRVYKYKVRDKQTNKEIQRKLGMNKDKIRLYVKRYEELRNIPAENRFYK